MTSGSLRRVACLVLLTVCAAAWGARVAGQAVAVSGGERETLDAEEIAAAMDGRELPARQRVVIPTWSEKSKTQKDKKRPASIFGAPKPAPSA